VIAGKAVHEYVHEHVHVNVNVVVIVDVHVLVCADLDGFAVNVFPNASSFPGSPWSLC
jgi:hypothetical protein